MKASVTTMSDKPVDHTWVELNKAIDAAGTNGAEPSIGFTGKGIVEAALGVKARVISISRDYLTLEFERGQQIDFQQGQVVSVSK